MYNKQGIFILTKSPMHISSYKKKLIIQCIYPVHTDLNWRYRNPHTNVMFTQFDLSNHQIYLSVNF